jgi:hypothetical protein
MKKVSLLDVVFMDIFLGCLFLLFSSFWLREAVADCQTPNFSDNFYKNHFDDNHKKIVDKKRSNRHESRNLLLSTS